jgi:CDP-diacylglycerol--serine O-phosphatidyltransferase
MVSKIPTFAFKGMNIQPNQIIFLLGIIGVFVIGMMTRPWLTLPIVSLAYLISFVFSFNAYRKDIQRD